MEPGYDQRDLWWYQMVVWGEGPVVSSRCGSDQRDLWESRAEPSPKPWQTKAGSVLCLTVLAGTSCLLPCIQKQTLGFCSVPRPPPHPDTVLLWTLTFVAGLCACVHTDVKTLPSQCWVKKQKQVAHV